MTEEKVQARKQEAEKAREQALANARHWGGVIADCDYWLEELREDESEFAERNQVIEKPTVDAPSLKEVVQNRSSFSRTPET